MNFLSTVVVAVRSSAIPTIRGHLSAWGTVGIAVRSQGADRFVVEAGFDDATMAHGVARSLREAGAMAVAGPSGPGHRVAWERRNAPSWFASRSCVCFPWTEFDRTEADTIVEIDPGAGFGSGGHPTTSLLLGALHERVRGGERLLDVGTGTGVLAIAGLLAGAESAVGIDIEPEAVAAAHHNAELNGVLDRLEVSDRMIEDLEEPPFDVVVANIHAPALVAMAPHLRRLLAPGGWLGLSGISRAQISTLAAALTPLVVEAEMHSDDWSALIVLPG